MANFGNGDPIHILALCLIYWLILLPHLTFMSLKLVIGDQEVENKTVNIRTRDNQVHGEKAVDKFIEELQEEISTRK